MKTVLKRYDGYWNKNIKTNIDEVIFQPITQEATRVAALISGEMDLVQPVPVQDWKRLEDAKGVKPLTAPEARAIFIGMDQSRDELLFSDVKGKNPFKDPKVREAVVLAVDTKIINDKIMRGAASRWARWSPPRSTAMTSPTARRTSRIPSAPRSCWPRPAIPRASPSPWTAPTIATSTTKRSARPWPAC